MAVASIRVSSVQLTTSSGATSAFYSGAAAAATRAREGVAAIGLGRNEGERPLIRGLRFYLTKAGKKAYFCYKYKPCVPADDEYSFHIVFSEPVLKFCLSKLNELFPRTVIFRVS